MRRGRYLLTQNARYWLVRACERNTVSIQNALFSHRQRRPIELGATITDDVTGKLRGQVRHFVPVPLVRLLSIRHCHAARSHMQEAFRHDLITRRRNCTR